MKKIAQKFSQKKVVFLGLGIENMALIDFLLKKQIKPAQIIIADPLSSSPSKKRQKELKNLAQKNNYYNLSFQSGAEYDKNLEKFDLILRSPGYPLFSKNLKKAKFEKKEISSPMKIFFEACPSKNIIGITGTKGKGTTASLVYEIFKQAKREVFLGGNIGVAPFSFFDQLSKTSWIILELSSFQLEDMTKSPKIGVITNLYKEHLKAVDPNNPNYHKKVKDYWEAKLNIFKYQTKTDKAIVNQRFKKIISKYSFSSKVNFFSKADLKTGLFGEHNLENIGAAQEVARVAKIKPDIIKKAVASFKGLEHRLELVKEDKRGVKYFNDSFATTPDATITALKSFHEPIILLAGGADKGSDFKKLAQEIKKKCRLVLLFQGEASPRLKEALVKISFPESDIKEVASMKRAVQIAKKESQPGEIVLLSTACASFGLFKNYKQRGKLFKREVK